MTFSYFYLPIFFACDFRYLLTASCSLFLVASGYYYYNYNKSILKTQAVLVVSSSAQMTQMVNYIETNLVSHTG